MARQARDAAGLFAATVGEQAFELLARAGGVLGDLLADRADDHLRRGWNLVEGIVFAQEFDHGPMALSQAEPFFLRHRISEVVIPIVEASQKALFVEEDVAPGHFANSIHRSHRSTPTPEVGGSPGFSVRVAVGGPSAYWFISEL